MYFTHTGPNVSLSFTVFFFIIKVLSTQHSILKHIFKKKPFNFLIPVLVQSANEITFLMILF